MKQVQTGPESTAKDRILFIGATSKPMAEGVDPRDYANFDEKVYLSFPDYGSSLQIWKHYLEKKGVKIDPTIFNLSTLAKVLC